MYTRGIRIFFFIFADGDQKTYLMEMYFRMNVSANERRGKKKKRMPPMGMCVPTRCMTSLFRTNLDGAKA